MFRCMTDMFRNIPERERRWSREIEHAQGWWSTAHGSASVVLVEAVDSSTSRCTERVAEKSRASSHTLHDLSILSQKQDGDAQHD